MIKPPSRMFSWFNYNGFMWERQESVLKLEAQFAKLVIKII